MTVKVQNTYWVSVKGALIRFTSMSSAFGCGAREAWPRASVPHSPWWPSNRPPFRALGMAPES